MKFAAFVIASLLAGIAYSQSASSDEAIRSLLATFADARNAHDGKAVAALYSEDGEWVSGNGARTVKGRSELAALWGGVLGQVKRTVHSIDFPGPHIAVARVDTQYPEPTGLHHESFVFVKESGKWYILVHESVD